MGNGCYNLHRWSFNSIYNCLGPTLTLYEENHLKTNNHPMLFIPCQKTDEQNHPEDNQKLPGFFGNSSRPSWANSWVVGFFESKEINHPWMFVFFFFCGFDSPWDSSPLLPWKPTCPLKINGWKMYSLLNKSRFKGHVSFQGSKLSTFWLEHTFGFFPTIQQSQNPMQGGCVDPNFALLRVGILNPWMILKTFQLLWSTGLPGTWTNREQLGKFSLRSENHARNVTCWYVTIFLSIPDIAI